MLYSSKERFRRNISPTPPNMRKYFAPILLLVCIGLVFIGCNSRPQPFVRVLPPAGFYTTEVLEGIVQVRDSLRLDTLENGYNTLQIRLWAAPPFGYRQQVFILKKQQGQYSARLVTFTPRLSPKRDSLLGYSMYEQFPLISIDWDKFMHALNNCNIATLPDQTTLLNYTHPLDGVNYIVEVATQNSYRLYTYHEPGMNLQIKEAAAMVKITHLISEYTGFTFFEVGR